MLRDDRETRVGAVGGLDHAAALGDGDGHRLLDEDVLAGRSGRDDLVGVTVGRGGDDDGVHVAPGKQRLVAGLEGDAVILGQGRAPDARRRPPRAACPRRGWQRPRPTCGP